MTISLMQTKRHIGLFSALFSTMTMADIGYTQEELRAFSKLEQQAQETPLDATLKQTIDQKRQASLEFQEAARASAEHWQAALNPKLLQGAIDIPDATPNPQAAPTGVLVFVSLTMPESSLKALLKQSEHWQVPLVIRGVLPQGFTATTNKIQALLETQKKEPIQSGFAISPQWFRTFNITEVPTFVAVKPGRCLPEQPCHQEDFDIVKGNVSISDALQHLATGDNPDVVKQVLLRGNR